MCILLIAFDATTIALIPFSGSIPACAFFPLKVISIASIAGALYARVSAPPVASTTTNSLHGSIDISMCFVPIILISSEQVNTR